MPSTTLASADSTRPLRRLHPWEDWITSGTPTAPLKLVIGKQLPKTYKLSSLVSQLHHYAKAHNATLPAAKRRQLFTSRLSDKTLLVYSIPAKSAKPKNGNHRPNAALYRGKPIQK